MHVVRHAFCPSCREACSSMDETIPNYTLNAIIRGMNADEEQEAALNQHKQNRQHEREQGAMHEEDRLILRSFLQDLLDCKSRQVAKLQDECECIKRDMNAIVEGILQPLFTENADNSKENDGDDEDRMSSVVPSYSLLSNQFHGFKVHHSKELQEMYEECTANTERMSHLASAVRMSQAVRGLKELVSFGPLEYQAQQAPNAPPAPHIISAIEVQQGHQERLFATAGVSKKIRLWDLRAILSSVDNGGNFSSSNTYHYPTSEIDSAAKVSCLAWNGYFGDRLAAADYNGAISLYDTAHGSRIGLFSEHEKRAWTVDFCPLDPDRMASGSDDCIVKVWSCRARQSALSIPNARGNVCSVRFHPTNINWLAVGSAGI